MLGNNTTHPCLSQSSVSWWVLTWYAFPSSGKSLGISPAFWIMRKLFTPLGGQGKRVRKKKITFFYCKDATPEWDPNQWWWVKGYHFLNHTTNLGETESLINKIVGMIKVADKWQGYLPRDYKIYWSQMWDLAHSGKEATFMWHVWHKAIVVNGRRACIALKSISKQCVFCLPNTSK